jgi:cytochrome c oxidase subunit 2
MRGEIIVESQEEFDAWFAGKKSQYYVANPDSDPTLPKAAADTVKAVAVITNGK